MNVLLTVEAQGDFDALPATIRTRVLDVFGRLSTWPNVSGTKAMRGEWRGHFRVRTGDWRVIFYIALTDDAVVVVRIGHRSTIYEE